MKGKIQREQDLTHSISEDVSSSISEAIRGSNTIFGDRNGHLI